MAVVSVALSAATQCGSQLTSAADCTALLDFKAAAPGCLAKVEAKKLCGWTVTDLQQIYCSGGRVKRIWLED